MNRSPGGRHGRMAVALAVVAAMATACGGNSATTIPTVAAPPAATGAGPTATAAAVSDREPNCQNMTTDTVTLNYWDDLNENLSDAGVAKLDTAFKAKYPNVTLNRTAKTFSDILTTEKLQASAPNPPDILITNGGYALLGPLVAAGLMKPLDDYATAYGWDKRFPEGINRQQRFSTDGKTYGTGSLWTVAPTATYVGLFVHKANLQKLGLQLPTSFADFDASLA